MPNKKKSEAFERQNLTILFLLIIFFVIIIIFYFVLDIYSKDYAASLNSSNNSSNLPENTATKIIDGDTFELASGEKVRLICIDAPEENKKGYEEAKQFLSYIILNKQVRLEKDVSETDRYGRLLRYAYINSTLQSDKEIFVNRELVKQGYATSFLYGNDTKRCNEISS